MGAQCEVYFQLFNVIPLNHESKVFQLWGYTAVENFAQWFLIVYLLLVWDQYLYMNIAKYINLHTPYTAA